MLRGFFMQSLVVERFAQTLFVKLGQSQIGALSKVTKILFGNFGVFSVCWVKLTVVVRIQPLIKFRVLIAHIHSVASLDLKQPCQYVASFCSFFGVEFSVECDSLGLFVTPLVFLKQFFLMFNIVLPERSGASVAEIFLVQLLSLERCQETFERISSCIVRVDGGSG